MLKKNYCKPLNTLFNFLIYKPESQYFFPGIYFPAAFFLAVFVSAILFYGLSPASAEVYKQIYSGEFENNSFTYTFGENINVRKSDKIASGNLADKINAGRKVKILSKASEYTINGFTQNWYEIEYENDKKTRTGFVWGGFLSMAHVLIKDEENDDAAIAMAGIKNYSHDKGFAGELRICKNGKIISSAEFTPHNMTGEEKQNSYSYGVAASISGPAELSGVKNIIKINCIYEACGYPNGSSYFSWDGKKVSYIIKDEYISEAGCFNYEKKVIFPGDKGGEKDRIIIEENSSEFDEVKNDYVLKSSKKEKFDFKNGNLTVIKQ
jgi:hypothetical protein